VSDAWLLEVSMDLKRGALCVEFSCDVGVGLAAENTQ
jgi:hypothetical protein